MTSVFGRLWMPHIPQVQPAINFVQILPWTREASPDTQCTQVLLMINMNGICFTLQEVGIYLCPGTRRTLVSTNDTQMVCILPWSNWHCVVLTWGHKAKDIIHSVALRRRIERGWAQWTFLERTRKGHAQSDQYWNWFKGNAGKLLTDEVERIWAFMGASSTQANTQTSTAGTVTTDSPQRIKWSWCECGLDSQDSGTTIFIHSCTVETCACMHVTVVHHLCQWNTSCRTVRPIRIREQKFILLKHLEGENLHLKGDLHLEGEDLQPCGWSPAHSSIPQCDRSSCLSERVRKRRSKLKRRAHILTEWWVRKRRSKLKRRAHILSDWMMSKEKKKGRHWSEEHISCLTERCIRQRRKEDTEAKSTSLTFRLSGSSCRPA